MMRTPKKKMTMMRMMYDAEPKQNQWQLRRRTTPQLHLPMLVVLPCQQSLVASLTMQQTQY